MTATVAALKPKPVPQLSSRRCHLEQHEARTWRVYPEPGHTREQVTNPEYWAQESRRHRVGDRINALWEDGSVYAEFLIVACDKTWTKVHVLSWHDLADKPAAKVDVNFAIEWRGSVKKHCIVRSSDGAIVQEGISTKAEAETWLEQNRPNLT